jgi:carbon monoxide dehydrogenase subunit G
MAKRSFEKKAYTTIKQLGYKAGPIAKRLGSKAVDIASSKAANYLVNTLASTAAAAAI